MTSSQRAEREVPWQPAQRTDWQFSPVKHHFDILLGKMLQPKEQSLEDVAVPYFKAQHVQWDKVLTEDLPTMWATPGEISSLRVRKGDLLVCEGGEVGRAAIVTEEPPKNCIIQNALHLVRPKQSGDVRFLRYLLQQAASHEWLNVLCNRATIAHFTAEKFSGMWIWAPPLPEQHAIADYLDRETSKIDALITEKERLLSLLAEKRRALITQAVTRGLNPDVPMRDSGVEWLGEIPGHWEKQYARWLFREIDERSDTGEGELLTVSHLTGVTRRSEKEVNMFMAETLEGYKICQPGDLVINTLWAWMGAMGIAFQGGLVSPAYNVYRSLGQLEPRFVDYLVRIPIFAEEVTRYSKGVWSSRLRLYPEEFFQVTLPIPPIEEQRIIIDYLDKEIEKLDSLNIATQETIKLLQERRAVLISAAVTGQIRVGGES